MQHRVSADMEESDQAVKQSKSSALFWSRDKACGDQAASTCPNFSASLWRNQERKSCNSQHSNLIVLKSYLLYRMVQAILWSLEIADGSSLYRLPNADNEVIHELPPGWLQFSICGIVAKYIAPL